MNILCTICIRGNSKGVRNKNKKLINGKPLLYYTIKQAVKSKIFTDIAVSSESENLIKICKRYGIKNTIKRPLNLSKDNTPKVSVIKHALIVIEKIKKKKFDIVVDLDVTSPLREVYDIKKALKKFIKMKFDNLFSVSEAKKSPYFNIVEIIKKKISLVKKKKKKIFSRQMSPKVFDMNASIYIWKRETLLKNNSLFLDKTGIYLMPQERSLDIDTMFDFQLVKLIMSKRLQKNKN